MKYETKETPPSTPRIQSARRPSPSKSRLSPRASTTSATRFTPERIALIISVESPGSRWCAAPTKVAMVANRSEHAIIRPTPRAAVVASGVDGSALGMGAPGSSRPRGRRAIWPTKLILGALES